MKKDDFEIENGTLVKYSGSDTEVIIPDSVKIIGDWAFDGCENLKSITIPDGVTEIGGGAFKDCSSLKSITIPDSGAEIGKYAFRGCPPELTIRAPKGSFAKKYAKEYKIIFECL